MHTKSPIRRIWMISLLIAGIEVAVSWTAVAALITKGFPVVQVLAGTTLITQLLLIPFIIGFTVPSVMTIIKKADMTMDIGRKSSESLGQLQSEFVPVLQAIKKGIGDLSTLLENVSHGNGELKETIRKAVGEARILVKDGESELEKFLYDKIDKFLSGAFAHKEDENGKS